MQAQRCRWFGAILMAALVGALLILSVPAVASAPRHVRVGMAPRHPAGSRTVGPLAAKTHLSALVSLKPSDPSGLAAYAEAVSTPGSSVYHQFLTVAEFRQRFAPTQTQIESVESALRDSGLRPGAVSANGLLIHVSARAGAFARAFSTRFQRVRLRSGRTAFANTSAPQFPSTVSGYVRGVIGLDSLITPRPLGLASARRGSVVTPHAQPAVVTGGPQPCSAAGSSNTADKIASAYDFSPLYQAGDEGAGQTIGLLELEPNLTSDIASYQSCYKTSTSVSYVAVDGFNQTGTGGGEAALDIEQVIGLAPQAKIEVYQAPAVTNQNLIDDYTAMINDPTVNVISTSWGACEPNASTVTQTENTLFMQAASEGKSVFAASGDSGSEDCSQQTKPNTALAVDDPASQPFVTGVGGTNLSNYTNPSAQTVWNDSAFSAAGGGISSLWTMPSYQSGAPSSLNVINSNSSGSTCGAPAGTDCREVPDVSANAEPNSPAGYPIFYSSRWVLDGGTSASAPLWAAYTALVNSSTACGGVGIGFANPLLYQAAGASYAGDFYDTTSGDNNPTGTGLYPAGSGYDMATGLGSPIGATLATRLCNEADVVSVTNPGSQQTVFDGQVTLQIVASDNQHHALSYAAAGLPTGLSINTATGQITGTVTKTGNYNVTVTVTDGTSSGTAAFAWTVPTGGSSCKPANPNLLVNPTFASGGAGWVASPNVIASNAGSEVGFDDSHFAWLDGYSTPQTDTLSQTVTLPLGCVYQLSYEQAIDTTEPNSSAVDTLSMQVLASNGTVLYSPTPVSNLNATGSAGAKPSYQKVSVDLTSYIAGQQTITLKFTGAETNSGGGTTDFLLDGFALTVTPAS